MGIEIAVGDIPLRLLLTDIRDPHLDIYTRGQALGFAASLCEERCVKHTFIPAVPVCKGLVGDEAEVYGIGIAVVPATTDAGVASDLVIIHHLDLTTDELLLFAAVGDGVLA